ncbi:hypothetical protein EJ03DRAFT_13099 [Teratosphaeria nubilosa]|uniref:Uncharacterized protein n=1 Tax=Teratosphaeria nubilosa TaxID=161662 RepID=A0A6G1KW27_9PEZI|nr:hypothetical protein EJ03DRAFT_13099 [Teratosphaeria nubilosa]
MSGAACTAGSLFDFQHADGAGSTCQVQVRGRSAGTITPYRHDTTSSAIEAAVGPSFRAVWAAYLHQCSLQKATVRYLASWQGHIHTVLLQTEAMNSKEAQETCQSQRYCVPRQADFIALALAMPRFQLLQSWLSQESGTLYEATPAT